jgi:RHS repeat-associated protein
VYKGFTPVYAAQFTYRGADLGQALIVSGTTSYTDTYLYDESGNPLELLRQTKVGGNLSTARYWYVLDGRGNVVALTDVSGNVVDRYSYGVWGALVSSSEAVPQRLRYGGYWYDAELNWYWASVRYYSPVVKRWLQPDPRVRQLPRHLPDQLASHGPRPFERDHAKPWRHYRAGPSLS